MLSVCYDVPAVCKSELGFWSRQEVYMKQTTTEPDRREVRLAQGTIHYRDTGSGAPLVFVHGLLVNGLLWRKVVPELSGEFRCVVPDWPLGSHADPMAPEADLSPPGVARLISEFLEALELEDVTLIGNDTGGALCQLVATRHPERLARLVLTPCDAYDNFLPALFRPLQWAARVPGTIYLLTRPMRIRALRRLPVGFGLLAKRPIDDAITDAYLAPVLTRRAIRRDVERFLSGISARYTLDAARRFPDFHKPVLVAWAPEDRVFKLDYAERMAAAFPQARLERIEDSFTFVPEDQPRRTATLIAAFVRESAAARAA
jgi:pimeloyl-ACP methyl ester carboxylesterase